MMNKIAVLAALLLMAIAWQVDAVCRKPPAGDSLINGPTSKKGKYFTNEEVTYECKEIGYRIAGQNDNTKTTASITCTGRKWSGPRPCCEKVEGSLLWVIGQPSAIDDDAPSEVFCPDGYYAAACVCHKATICDGTRFSASKVSQCTALLRTGQSEGVMAVAGCAPISGKDIMVVENRLDLDTAAALCPSGYNMAANSSLYYWSQSRKSHLTFSVDDVMPNEASQLAITSLNTFMCLLCVLVLNRAL